VQIVPKVRTRRIEGLFLAQKGRVEVVFAGHGVWKSEPNDVFRRHKTPNEVRTFGRNGAKVTSWIDKLTSVVENLVFFIENIAVTDKGKKNSL
jgi:hypothetical protein